MTVGGLGLLGVRVWVRSTVLLADADVADDDDEPEPAPRRPHLRTEVELPVVAAVAAVCWACALEATAAEMAAEPDGTLKVRTGLLGKRLEVAAVEEPAPAVDVDDATAAAGAVFGSARLGRTSGLTLRSCIALCM